MTQPDDAAETQAARRYYTLHLVRVLAIIGLAAGLAMAREVIPGPYWLGVGLALAGVAAFFFAPYALVKRWKQGERGEP